MNTAKKLENQLQIHHLKWQESMADNKERWLEQGTRLNIKLFDLLIKFIIGLCI
jgi:hypothetical protein